MKFTNKFKLCLICIAVLMFMNLPSICAHDLSAENNTVTDDSVTISDENVVYPELDTFDDLQKDIDNLSSGDVYTFNKDYHYVDKGSGDASGIVIDKDNITVNGNGHTLDGCHLSSLIKIAGNNVKIYNLTLTNGNLKNLTVKDDNLFLKSLALSPIIWEGNNGLICDCTISDNEGINGGAIRWEGDNGVVNNTRFINNQAQGVGGAIYILGTNTTICHSTFRNSSSILTGEAIFLDRKGKHCHITGNFDNLNPVIAGNATGIDVSYLEYGYGSRFCDVNLDLVRVIYSSIVNNYLHIYNDGIIYFSSYNGTDFILNVAKNFNDSGIVYGKAYHFFKVSDYNDVFKKLLEDKYSYELMVTKTLEVKNLKDYENAIKVAGSDFDIPDAVSKDLINSMRLDSISTHNFFNSFHRIIPFTFHKQLVVNFVGQNVFNSKSTWKPSDNYDSIVIHGNNSIISVSSGKRDEARWAHIKSEKCLFIASDLTIEGFNMAVRNEKGTCIFNNVNFHKNKMKYIIDKDYGAGICNTGACICYNCTFSDNYCKYGAGIFNQGYLEVYNCTFNDNDAYGKGDDILNVDKAIVKVDGVQINKTGGVVKVVKSLSKKTVKLIKILAPAIAFVTGFVAGFVIGGPVAGLVVGAIFGAAIGVGSAIYVCNHIYDINTNKVALAAMLIVTCTAAGAAGGFLGGYLSGIVLQNHEVVVVDQSSSIESSSIVEESDSGIYYGDTLDWVF